MTLSKIWALQKQSWKWILSCKQAIMKSMIFYNWLYSENTVTLKAQYDLREEVDWAASICESSRWKSGCLMRRRSAHFNALFWV